MPVDVVVMPMQAKAKDLPLFIEAKSASDLTNTNKRRKKEAAKGIDWAWEHRIDDLKKFGL